MLLQWERFAGWKVMRHFLEHPSQEVHARAISRMTKLSPRSTHIYCGIYEKDGLLVSERKANAKMLRLRNGSPAVAALKKFYFLEKLQEMHMAENAAGRNPKMISLALYGSYASGEYDEQSDVDILVLSDTKADRQPFVKLQSVLGKNVQLTELPLAEWIGMKNRKDAFALSVLANNVVLYGARL